MAHLRPDPGLHGEKDPGTEAGCGSAAGTAHGRHVAILIALALVPLFVVMHLIGGGPRPH